MAHFKQKLKTALRPVPGSKVWPDVAMLLLFGTWFFVPTLYMLFHKSDPNEYACSGPGFADFGCTGGWEATVASLVGLVFMFFLFVLFLAPLLRLIHRMKGRSE